MTDKLSLLQIAVLLAYAAGMAGGQLLFKAASFRLATGSITEGTLGLLMNGYFLTAVVLYAALTVLWVWILSVTPLTRAYPFLAFSFALTPLLGSFVFAEPLSLRLVGGLVLILGGLVLVAG